ncbi:MAG: hypothetical protein ACI84K_001326 [Pseudohongiellaceae bacterium]|jgi:hypothetical protein
MKRTKIYTSLILATTLTACGSNSSDRSPEVSENLLEETNIALGFVNSDGNSTEFVLSESDLMEGTISAQGAGLEQAGWNFYYPVGNTLFVSGYTEFKTTAYKLNGENEVAELNTFLFDSSFNTYGNVNDTTLLATNSYWSQHDDMVMYTADASTGRATSKIDYSIYNDFTGIAGEGTVPWPTALKVRDDKLFVPYLKFRDDGSASTTDNNTAYVAVFDYPLTANDDGNVVPSKIITDERTSNIGTHGSTTGLIEAANGDLYGYAAGSIASGHSPASEKPSGILRIASGETEFDTNYFFNIEDQTEGSEIFWFDSIGANKALARIFTPTDELEAIPWSAYSSPVLKLVILDLAEKTITDIEGIPLHTKQVTSSTEVMDGKVYVMVDALVDEVIKKNIYQIDIATATATKGATVEGKTIKGFFALGN